ncbi:hypothetical protein HX021_16725 [Sphingobacterium sp. N143]|uniref:asparagine synthase-related protein n=1 Tax=Sphingobacterium sp. N143 TaxID=2746727 RepID=UPI0025787C6E|nr:asparagine synthase-related protein [Sphingobacterium sp. N143]MDM1295937.1 hypothetical protein [Sphingobacterium sp. N143]
MISFKHYNHLGFHNPYYLFKDKRMIIEPSFEDVINHIPIEERVLDFSALVEVFSTGYCFGDRTLIRGVRKSPWMARPNENSDGWDYFEVPDHGEKAQDVKSIVKEFYTLLREELLSYVQSYQNIGILLTGGMDSRIVAAVMKNLLNEGEISDKSIYAYTWGHEKSRDVIYSSSIAKMFGWEWKHVVVDEKQMLENCQIAIQNGCEFTPIHLHAMSEITKEQHLDCVLAGSFGDSVGRAEFSGKKVRDISGVDNKIKNFGGILRDDFRELVMNEVKQDIKDYHTLFPQKYMYQQYEQDQQIHYMRRMLNACMSIIDKKVPLYQMFSSPNVFGYMWSLVPENRTDEVYKVLLEGIAPELLDIPWARTGLRYPEKEGAPDLYRKSHHDYGRMIREHFLDSITETIERNKSSASLLFDVRSIQKLIHNIRSLPISGKLVFEEKLLYVKQILEFINKFDVKIELPDYHSSSFVSMKEDFKYKGRYLYSKIR